MSLGLRERRSQRWALRAIFVVLGLLALALGVRSGGPDDTPAPPAPSAPSSEAGTS